MAFRSDFQYGAWTASDPRWTLQSDSAITTSNDDMIANGPSWYSGLTQMTVGEAVMQHVTKMVIAVNYSIAMSMFCHGSTGNSVKIACDNGLSKVVSTPLNKHGAAASTRYDFFARDGAGGEFIGVSCIVTSSTNGPDATIAWDVFVPNGAASAAAGVAIELSEMPVSPFAVNKSLPTIVTSDTRLITRYAAADEYATLIGQTYILQMRKGWLPIGDAFVTSPPSVSAKQIWTMLGIAVLVGTVFLLATRYRRS